MADANIYSTPLDEVTGRTPHPGFGARRKSLGRLVGARHLGLSLFEVPPGEAAYPYHFHLGEEELLVVLDGDGRIRTADGWRRLVRGEVLSFLPGEGGGHQLVADGAEPLRFLAFSTNGAPDLVVYPDSDKIGACERAGDGSAGVWEFYRRADAVPYWHDEAAPERG